MNAAHKKRLWLGLGSAPLLLGAAALGVLQSLNQSSAPASLTGMGTGPSEAPALPAGFATSEPEPATPGSLHAVRTPAHRSVAAQTQPPEPRAAAAASNAGLLEGLRRWLMPSSFDANGDGRLNPTERQRARGLIEQRRRRNTGTRTDSGVD